MVTFNNGPGVYVSESALSSLAPSATSGTAAVFFGTAERGPQTATLITDWASYKATYGELKNEYDLGYAVYHYFANGGRACYVVRVTAEAGVAAGTDASGVPFYPRGYLSADLTATSASVSLTSNVATVYTNGAHGIVAGDTVTVSGLTTTALNATDVEVTAATADTFSYALTASDVAFVEDGTGTATVTPASRTYVAFDVDAISKGSWGNDVTVSVSLDERVAPSSTNHSTFNLSVVYDGVEVEKWVSLSIDPNDSRYITNYVNNYSKYVRVSNVNPSAPTPTASETFVSGAVALSTGADGTVDTTDFQRDIDAVDTIRGNLILNAPGRTDVVSDLITKATNRGDSFVIIDPAEGADTVNELQATPWSSTSSYAAYYGPMLKMVDPAKSGVGAVRDTYPGGAIAGLYVRTENQRSVAKAPAGFNADIRGALGTVGIFSDAEIGSLYDGSPHLNVLKPVAGAGVIVNGARTLARSAPDKFVPVRRTLNYLKNSLKELTEFAVFEPNNENLWRRLNTVVSGFLAEFYREGGLRGNTPGESFYVVCNSTNNTAVSIDQGIVNIEVGVALQYPAEYIVINLSQWTGGSNATESL
jgi:hypothetical protein